MSDAAAAQTHDSKKLWSYLVIVSVASFATTFPQQRMLGNLPTVFLLKDQLHFGKEQVAEFFLWATFAWNLKPIAGVITDAFPLFGSRRKVYLLLGALGAALCWGALGAMHGSYAALLGFSIALNSSIVFASTAMGGLQVEASQMFAAPGRITSLRQIFSSIAQLSAPLLGGWLATKAFGITAGLAAATLVTLAVVTFAVLKEPKPEPLSKLTPEELARPRYKPSVGVVLGILAFAGAAVGCALNEDTRNVGYSLFALLAVFFVILGMAVVPTENPVIYKAQGQLSQILSSKTLWLAVVMLFLIYMVPGFYTVLTYKQTDELKFSKEFIGTLSSWEAGLGLIAAFVYAATCKRFTLRTLMVGSVLTNAVVTLGYLYYTDKTALAIHAIGGFVVIGSELSLMDLAVRSTPKGCEALGFALMMSVRNFGVAMSDVVGSKLNDQFHISFNKLVLINAATTAAVLLFTPLLPKAVLLKREGEAS